MDVQTFVQFKDSFNDLAASLREAREKYLELKSQALRLREEFIVAVDKDPFIIPTDQAQEYYKTKEGKTKLENMSRKKLNNEFSIDVSQIDEAQLQTEVKCYLLRTFPEIPKIFINRVMSYNCGSLSGSSLMLQEWIDRDKPHKMNWKPIVLHRKPINESKLRERVFRMKWPHEDSIKKRGNKHLTTLNVVSYPVLLELQFLKLIENKSSQMYCTA